MNGKIIFSRFKSIAVIMGLIICESLAAQSYVGYLRPVGEKEAPDSILVTITLPEGQTLNPESVRDTVYLDRRGTPIVRRYSSKAYYDTPWMFGVKTNLLFDAALALPYGGLEIQIARHMSLDLSGWFGSWNIYYPNEQTRIYGFSPEIRWWFGDKVMREGHFIGIQGNTAWYTLEWKNKDGINKLYQNGTPSLGDIGNKNPAWSCGLTYGYSLGLGRNDLWGLEFFLGLGYSSYQQKVISLAPESIGKYIHEKNTYVGITKIGVNLTYRFSLRRVKFGYYDN